MSHLHRCQMWRGRRARSALVQATVYATCDWVRATEMYPKFDADCIALRTVLDGLELQNATLPVITLPICILDCPIHHNHATNANVCCLYGS
jgi:hypothetical protein